MKWRSERCVITTRNERWRKIDIEPNEFDSEMNIFLYYDVGVVFDVFTSFRADIWIYLVPIRWNDFWWFYQFLDTLTRPDKRIILSVSWPIFHRGIPDSEPCKFHRFCKCGAKTKGGDNYRKIRFDLLKNIKWYGTSKLLVADIL